MARLVLWAPPSPPFMAGFLRLIVKDESFSPLMANGSSMFIGGIFALITSYFVDSWGPLPVAAGNYLPFLQQTLLMTLISNIICYNLYGMLLRKYTATFLSFVGLLSPIFASLNGWIFLEKSLPSRTLSPQALSA